MMFLKITAGNLVLCLEAWPCSHASGQKILTELGSLLVSVQGFKEMDLQCQERNPSEELLCCLHQITRFCPSSSSFLP